MELWLLVSISSALLLGAVYAAGFANGRLEEIERYRAKTGGL